MRKFQGFALVQAMFLMMFVAGALSVMMVMKAGSQKKIVPNKLAVDAFPAVYGFVNFVALDPASTSGNSAQPVPAKDYYDQNPISNDYTQSLSGEGINPENMSVTITYS